MKKILVSLFLFIHFAAYAQVAGTPYIIGSSTHPSSNGTAIVSAYTCSTGSAGTMVAGVAVSGVTQTITATVTTVGTYSISTTANGVTFAGSGTFAGTGAQPIVLTATGTPTATGSNSFTLNTTPNCTFSRETFAQVLVSGAVTGNGNYVTLAAAFTAINGGVQTGSTITISVKEDTNESTTSASLDAGTWTSLTITPDGARTITGATTAGNPLINLNGADNVTINGLNTGGNSLTLSNTTVSATAGTSTIRFINDASNNTITNCTLSGSGTLATSGTIFFSTGTPTTGNGNDGNTISNCAITPAGSNLPVNAIYSAGTSVAIDNSGNTIDNNTIQDYFSPTVSSAGILLASNSAAWTITNNKLFQTATRTVSANTLTIRGIGVITASAGAYTISNNTIGFADAAGTGTTTYGGAFTTVYRGIELSANTTVSNLQGNTVAGINFTTSNTANSGAGVFSGIAVNSGAVNIGTTTANTIGSGATADAIVINKTVATVSRINGIYASSDNATSAIQNNIIGGFSSGTGATFSYFFMGISTAGASGNFTISNNTIGSTSLANSITMGDNNTTTGICTIYGIYNLATLGTISIDNNTISNTTVFGTGLSAIRGIDNNGGTTVTINSNTVANASTTGTGAVRVISNSGHLTTLQINNNTIRNFTIDRTTADFFPIINQGNATSSIAIDNNKLGDATAGLVTYTAGSSRIFYGIFSDGSSAAAALSIQNNDFRGIVHSVTASAAIFYIRNFNSFLSPNISGNTFTNLTANTTGDVYFIYNDFALPANGVQTISNNSIVTGFAKTGVSGNVYIFDSAGNSNASATITNTGNNFSNITVAGTSTIYGWEQQDLGSTTKTVSNNTFSNWTAATGAITVMTVNGFGNTSAVSGNTISTITGQAAITGLTIGSWGNATALNVNGNTITGLSSTGTGGAVTALASANNSTAVNIYANPINTLSSTGVSAVVTGLSVTGGTGTVSVYSNTLNSITGTGTTSPIAQGLAVSGGTTINVYKNKVYDIAENGVSTGAIVNGFNITGGTNVTCSNNIIGDLKAPNVSSTGAVRGILINSTLANSTYSLYYNSIYLNATSTGANFGSRGLSHTVNATATTARLFLNNNVIINNSTPNGTGVTTTFHRSNTALDNYDTSSNNNLFYAGVPGTNNVLLLVNTTTYRTLNDLQGFVAPRESNTTSGAVSFLSLAGASSNFLRPDFTDAATAALIENLGTAIGSVTEDFDGVSRATPSEIGAYEKL